MSETVISQEGAARVFVASIKGWGQTSSMIFFLDLICVLGCYFSVRPNGAIKLLAIGAALKAITVIPFYIGAGYTPEYSDATVNFITVTLEIGWFFYDHVITCSTLHRVLIFYQDNKKARYAFMALVSFTITFGAIFRGFRSTCRFGKCVVADSGACDSIIAANVIICEFILLFALLYKCTIYKKSMKQGKELFEAFIQEAYMRLMISFPLGIMEASVYILERIPSTPAALLWFLVIGIIARQFSATILALAILSTKSAQQNKKTSAAASSKQIGGMSKVPQSSVTDPGHSV
jgi:hypothetical protein